MNERAALKRVQRATAAKERAVREYRAALLAAHDAGCSYEAIGEAAGISGPGAHKVITHARGAAR